MYHIIYYSYFVVACIVLVEVLRKNAKKGLGPSINISTMAWNFKVKFGTQPYLRSINSCTKKSANSEGGGNMIGSFGME